MRLVADTSELFSFFNSESKARELSLSSKTELFSPYYSLEELHEKKGKIINCFSLTEAQYAIIIKLLETVVKYIRVDEYSKCLPEAMELCPDPDDVDFFALALKLDCPLWSEDRLLKNQSKIKVYSTQELKDMV
jgi:predicted nucleic acid-binding protein